MAERLIALVLKTKVLKGTGGSNPSLSAKNLKSKRIMAHKRKDTFFAPPEWWKHLKWQKRNVNKRERKGAKERIKKEIE
jgi:hypothetical protein